MRTLADPFVDSKVRLRIEAELETIERANDVRILFAAESGSRAWRFPSCDSDYDVRFVYVRPVEAYLTVGSGRDVIERPVDATLDVSGWDLLKALRLVLRSNAVLLEWLGSPVFYRHGGGDVIRLGELARSAADRTTLAYHYHRLARHGFDQVIASVEVARLKPYCYAVRAALAVKWLSERRELPPMDLPSLMAGLSLPATVRQSIDTLVGRKVDAAERDTTLRMPAIDHLVAEVLAMPVQSLSRAPRSALAAEADALFAQIVLRKQTIDSSAA